MYRADAHFRMGTSHEAEGSPCQDYALAENGTMAWAAVSDGCSTSGHTDIGARLWCLVARQLRLFSPKLTHYSDLMYPMILDTSMRLGLAQTDLDATLGVIFELRDGSIRSFLWGDGVMAARTPRGIEIVQVEWAGNMPGYPSYELDKTRRAEFVTQSTSLADGAAPCVMTCITIDPDGSVDSYRQGYFASEGLLGMQANWPSGTDVAVVLTDGVGQMSGLPMGDVVTELLSIPSARQGAFAKRRLNSALKRWAKDGHRPVDDISIAALVKIDDV